MSLADVIQWVDARGTRALVTVTDRDGRSTWLVLDARLVVEAQRPLGRGSLSKGAAVKALAKENLLDLFMMSGGTFVLEEDAPPPDAGVELALAAQFLVMEGLRLLDEWPRILETYPTDEARLAATDRGAERLETIDAAIRELALEAPALGEARLVLGLSRPALLRRVDALRARGLVEIEGIPHGPDVEGSLIAQARLLLDARQYAEAAHVFRSLLATNPRDVRVRKLLAEAEQLHCASFYERFAKTDVVTRVADPAGLKLRGADLALLDQLDRPRPVAVLVLTSPLRELETLVSLGRLSARGIVTIESAE